MRTVGNVNKISDKLKELIKPLEPGSFAEIQQLEVRRFQDPETKDITVAYPPQHIWLRDQITDPFTKQPVDIGVVKTFDAKDNTVTEYHDFDIVNRVNGKVFLDGKNLFHRELYEFFQICNFVENNLLVQEIDGKKVNFRDTSKDITLKIVDQKADARKRTARLSAKGEVLRHLAQMSVQDMREFAAAKNWPYSDPDILADKLYEYADQYPDEMKNDLEDPRIKRKALVQYALDNNILVFNAEAREMRWAVGGEAITKLEVLPGKEPVTLFADWTYTIPNGDSIIAEIRKKLPKNEETTDGGDKKKTKAAAAA